MTTADIPAERRALRPRRGDVFGRARWLAARGRNALRHRTRIAVLGTIIFVGMLVFLVLLPGTSRTMRAGLVLREGVQDTMPLVAAYERTVRDFQQADSLLREVRVRLAAPAASSALNLSPTQRWKRDSLAQVAAALSRLISRVENSPLPQTYRALGESYLLRGDARVQQLLDSLTSIEREREAFDAVGGVDPMFVALSARANMIGRAIQGIAEAQRTIARDEMNRILQAARDTAQLVAQMGRDSLALAAGLGAPPVPLAPGATAADSAAFAASMSARPVSVPVVDTLPFRARADTAGALRERAGGALAIARTFNADLEKRAREARDEANTLAPPLAMLVASLLLGLSVAFAFSLALEAARPAIADAAEAERITGVRVLGLIHAGERADVAGDRDRRQVDLLAPPELAPASRAYRAIHLHLAAQGSSAKIVTILGDEPGVAAAVAANIAFLAATEARNTLLIDGDTQTCGVSSVLHTKPAPGTAEVLSRRATWPAVITTPALGRDRTLDVVPAGGRYLEKLDASALEHSRDELTRIARRYDLCVITAAISVLEHPDRAVGPLDDVLLCVRVAQTTISDLANFARQAREAGIRLRGLVLWRGEAPAIRPREEQRVLAEAAQAPAESDVPILAG